MSQLQIDWSRAPAWAQFAAQDADGGVFWYDKEPFYKEASSRWCCSNNGDCSAAMIGVVRVGPKALWRESLVQRSAAAMPAAFPANSDDIAMLRAQIGHLLEQLSVEQLDALYAHVRKQIDAAEFDELNRQLDRPFGEVPREWQLKAFEAFLDGQAVGQYSKRDHEWRKTPNPIWAMDSRYRIEPKQS